MNYLKTQDGGHNLLLSPLCCLQSLLTPAQFHVHCEHLKPTESTLSDWNVVHWGARTVHSLQSPHLQPPAVLRQLCAVDVHDASSHEASRFFLKLQQDSFRVDLWVCPFLMGKTLHYISYTAFFLQDQM